LRGLGKKVKVTLLMDDEVVKRGKELGLNLSKVCENALIDMIERIESPKGDIKRENRFAKLENKDLVDWGGFEPPTSAMPRRRSYH
jgi:post-segregation antitoxin (ccd killing protein)